MTVVEPGGRRCPLSCVQAHFRGTLDAIASEIEALGIDLDRVQCQVLNVDLEDSVSFDTGSPGANASFAESLTIEVGLTLDVLEIMDVVICDEEPDE